MEILSCVLIPRKIYFQKAFADLSAQEKMLYLTAVIFAKDKNPNKGKVTIGQKALGEFSGVKNYQKGIKSLIDKKLVLKKESGVLFIQDYNFFSLEKEGLLNGFNNAISFHEPLKRKVYDEYNRTDYKFQYWKEVLFEELDYLEQTGYPLEWAKGILYKVYVYIKEQTARRGDFTYAKKFIQTIARNTTNSSIINQFPPRFPSQKLKNEAREELMKMREIFGEVSYDD